MFFHQTLHSGQCGNCGILLPRFCCKNSVRLFNSFTKHSVEKSYKKRSRLLRKNHHFFRQINAFTKEVTKELISRKFLSVIAFYSTFPHCVLCAYFDFTKYFSHEIGFFFPHCTSFSTCLVKYFKTHQSKPSCLCFKLHT